MRPPAVCNSGVPATSNSTTRRSASTCSASAMGRDCGCWAACSGKGGRWMKPPTTPGCVASVGLGDDGLGRQAGKKRRRRTGPHRLVHRLGTGVVGDAGIDQVDRHPLHADGRAAAGQAQRQHPVGCVPVQCRLQRRQGLGEHAGQLRCDDLGAADDLAVQRLRHRPRRVDGLAAEGLEAGDQQRLAAGAAHDGSPQPPPPGVSITNTSPGCISTSPM